MLRQTRLHSRQPHRLNYLAEQEERTHTNTTNVITPLDTRQGEFYYHTMQCTTCQRYEIMGYGQACPCIHINGRCTTPQGDHMKPPTVTQAYAMIRLLKKRAAPGDGERIEELKTLIALEKDKAAQLSLDAFFPADLAPAKGKR